MNEIIKFFEVILLFVTKLIYFKYFMATILLK